MDALSILAPMAPSDARRLALVAGSVAWTFADVAVLAVALARRLEARGVAPGSRAAFRASPSPETFLAILTLAALGVTIVPIHPRLSPPEVRTLLDVTRPDHVLDEADLALPSPDEIRTSREASRDAPLRAATTSREASPPPFAGSSFDATDALAAIDPRAAASPSPEPAPFAIVSTSGTTGRPKGAVLSRRAILASAEASAQNLGWEDADRWLLCMPLAHVGGLSIVTRCLVARRTVVMLPRFDARLVLDAIRAHGVTLLSVVPTMLHALLEADQKGARTPPGDTLPTLRAPLGDAVPTLRAPLGDTLPTLRAVLLGGAAAPPALLGECARRGVRVLTTYGLTEACSQVTSQSPRAPSRAGSGAPLPGMEVRIVADGSADLAPLPPRTVGQILVRGPALFDGYLLPDGTIDPAVATGGRSPDVARADDPAPDGAGFFPTGDLGELDEEGQLHVHVRRTDLVVTGGENVYPVEVEHAIEQIPGVRRAAVFGVPDERWGQIVAAAVEWEGAAAFDSSHLVDILSTTLAPHKRPRKWAIVDQLPLTGSGKLHRAGLADLYGSILRSPG